MVSKQSQLTYRDLETTNDRLLTANGDENLLEWLQPVSYLEFSHPPPLFGHESGPAQGTTGMQQSCNAYAHR